jgi:dTDP-4-dehydrorhamnose reductase
MEDDVPRPVNVYGATKLRGEQAVLAALPEAIVARVNFYGWSLSGDRSLAEFFINNLRAGNPVLGFTDVVFCPMLANQLARLVLAMVDKRLAGLFHVVGREPMSKYEFGVAVARRWGLDAGRISPRSVAGSGLAAPRTRNLHLSTHKLSTALGTALPAFSTGLDEFYAQSLQGYPQLIRGFSTVEEEA